MSQALVKLGLQRPLTIQQLKQRWRQLASEHHPDRGGDPNQFNDLRQAYETALKELIEQGCLTCEGTGYVVIQSGFNQLKMICKSCHGSGKVSA
jgi:DnaJ-class molecular chaperone